MNSNKKRDRAAVLLAGIGLVAGVLVLFLASAGTLLFAFYQGGYEDQLSSIFVVSSIASLMMVAVVEWPWRRSGIRAAMAVVRVLLIGVLLLWLLACFGTYSWLRVVTHPDIRVTEYAGIVLESEYLQGAHTMLRMAVNGLTVASLPLLALLYLAIIPGLRSAFDVIRVARDVRGD